MASIVACIGVAEAYNLAQTNASINEEFPLDNLLAEADTDGDTAADTSNAADTSGAATTAKVYHVKPRERIMKTVSGGTPHSWGPGPEKDKAIAKWNEK